MKINKNWIILLVVALVFVAPAIITPGLWSSFDSNAHITMIAQFHHALSYFQFPVIWTEGVAKYGLPFGIVAHQLIDYSGGLLTFITNDPLTSYKILWVVFSIISTFGMYRLLRRFTDSWPAITGTILYTFSAYHILNLYIRGALPEFAAAALLPFLLYELYEGLKEKKVVTTFIKLTLWYSLIIFTHPMFLLFSGILTGFFFLFYRPKKKYWIVMCIAILLAISFNAFYLVPLKLELKYFFSGQSSNLLSLEHGLKAGDIFTEEWEFTCSSGDTPELRCNKVQTGLPEIALFTLGFLLLLKENNQDRRKLYLFLLFVGSVTLVLSLQVLEPLFKSVSLLGSIQFQYRFLNLWLLVPPFILALFLQSIPKNKKIIIAGSILLVLFLRVPQLYVKNPFIPDRNSFYHDKINIHSVTMNTIWMSDLKLYPDREERLEIIEGEGTIYDKKLTPTEHYFKTKSDYPIKIANYTFFFPGWHAFVNGGEVTIEWQDIHNRGYMLITVPEGENDVSFVFADTKIRLVGKIISAVSIVGFIFFLVLYQRKLLTIPRLKRYFKL